MSIAQYIDHTLLKQAATTEEINKICAEAAQYHFFAVCIPPVYVAFAKSKLTGSPVKVVTVIGFPFGYNTIDIKAKEALQALNDGADELDMVMHIGALKEKKFDYLEHEITAMLQAVQAKNIVIKVIIESGILSNEEIIQCCNLYKNFKIQFLKTSTGYAEKGATIEAVELMRKHLPDSIRVKASGGIKTYDTALDFIKAGAARLGCSAGIAIVNSEKALTAG